MIDSPLHIIGGGLAGCEAAWQAANTGVSVVLHEMRPRVGTAAHQSDRLAELVCSNSFRSDDFEYNAVGLLHAEMRRANSLILACGDAQTNILAEGAPQQLLHSLDQLVEIQGARIDRLASREG